MPHGRKLAVIGLGYVGLPVAVAFGRQGTPVIGFDIDTARIRELKAGHDRTREVEPHDLAHSTLVFTSDPGELSAADFFIVTVPTPIDQARRPDLTALLRASATVGKALKKGDIVVYESTVYPGATEEDCVPVLEQVSGLEPPFQHKDAFPRQIGDRQPSATCQAVPTRHDGEHPKRIEQPTRESLSA